MLIFYTLLNFVNLTRGGWFDYLFVSETVHVGLLDNSTCYRFSHKEQFELLMNRACPIFYNEKCVDSIVYDPFEYIKYRCQHGLPTFGDLNKIDFANSTTLLNAIQHRDEYKRSWCMLTMFFAHNCPFSARIAPYFNAVPDNYSPIKAVAVNITYFSRLISRYGISGTPTILLWVNGVAVARMDGKLVYEKAISDLVESLTDLESKRVSITKDEPIMVTLDGEDDTIYLTAALITFFASMLYLFRNKFLDNEKIRLVVSKLGGNCDSIKQFLNG